MEGLVKNKERTKKEQEKNTVTNGEKGEIFIFSHPIAHNLK
jgi:hypothetical protein